MKKKWQKQKQRHQLSLLLLLFSSRTSRYIFHYFHPRGKRKESSSSSSSTYPTCFSCSIFAHAQKSAESFLSPLMTFSNAFLPSGAGPRNLEVALHRPPPSKDRQHTVVFRPCVFWDGDIIITYSHVCSPYITRRRRLRCRRSPLPSPKAFPSLFSPPLHAFSDRARL